MADGTRGGVMLFLALVSMVIGQTQSQGARNYSCGSAQFDLVLILDSSTSLQLENWKKLLTATQRLVNDIDIDGDSVRIGVVIYSNSAEIQFHLNTYKSKADIIKAISRLQYQYGQTNTADALRLMRTTMFKPENGDRPGIPNVAIVITDGVSTINETQTIPEADAARRQGIQIYAIGVALEATEELNAIAGRLENRYLIDNYDKLDEKLESIYKTLCPAKPDVCGLSSDLVIILDASTSVTQANYDKMLDFTKQLLKNADIDSGAVRVGILIYSTEVEIQFYLDQYKTKAEVYAAIDKIPYIYGSTNTADALATMHNVLFTSGRGDRPEVPNTCIVVTDGVSNINSRRTIPEADTARQKGIHVYAVGIGLTDTREVDGIANKPASENSFNVKDFNELKGLEEKIFSALCPEFTPATTQPPPQTCGLSKVDVVIILDASTSVTEANFKKMLAFSKDIVDKADIDSGSVRIGALIYSTEVEVQFKLNQYTTTAAVKAAIDKIPYIYGSTNSADALKTMHEVLFSASNGDRLDVDNVAFMITDGVSNINSRRTIPESEAARKKGIKIYAIGIGLDDTKELEGMASEPKVEHTFNVKKFEELAGLVGTIFGGKEACAPNEPPVSNAGNDVTIQLPVDYVTLDGRRSTDDKAVVAYQWIQTSGNTNIGMQGEDSAILRLSRLPAGDYDFMLTVFDEIGQSDDDTVRVTVKAPDFPPVANAGPDVEIQLPLNKVTLSGEKSTDDEAVVKYEWSIVKADDGSAVLNDRGSAVATLSELKAGKYTLKLTVYDRLGQLDEDEVDINVKAPDLPPVANAGRDVEIQLPTNEVTLSGKRSKDDVEVVRYEWSITKGDSSSVDIEGKNSAEVKLSGLKEGEYTLKLTVYDALGQKDDDTVKIKVKAADKPPVANAGPDVQIQLPVSVASVSGEKSTDDVGIVQYEWKLISESGEDKSHGVKGADKANAEAVDLIEGNYTMVLTVYDALGQYDTDEMIISVKARDLPPRANAGNDLTLRAPTDSVTLDGSKSTDDVRIVSYSWSLVAGSSDTMRLEGIGDPQLRVSGLKAGSYTFELTVRDALGQRDADRVDVVVTARDTPPVARAGDDVTVNLPINYVTLDGSQSYDDVRIVRYRWQLQSGDKRGVKVEGDRSPVLKLSNMKAGSYRFSLTVSDSEGQRDIDDVLVTVIEDNPPVADAGSDVVIQLPDHEVTLRGNRSSDDVRIVTYSWRLVSGDRSVQMDGQDEPNLDLAGLKSGSYTFELTVTDASGQQDKDEVTVVVNPALTTAAPVCGLEKIDLIFVVDASTSVTEVNFKKQLDFMKSIIRYADVDSGSVRFGALIYSTEVEIQFHLNSFKKKADVLAAVDKIPYIYGSTNTADGLMTMRNTMFSYRNGDRDDAPNVAMVITDGVSNINSRRTIPEAEQSRDIGIHIYAVGIGLTDTRELDAIASVPASANAFAVKDFDELAGLENKIFTSVCEATTTPAPTTTTSTTTPMPTTTPSADCLTKTDLVFILDASTSVTETNFQKMRDFLKDFLKSADVNSGSARIGINIYSTEVQVIFHLNQYSTEAQILRAIDEIPYIYGSTNTADALKVMSNEMFVPARGDRPDAPNIAMLITDGISNINSRRTIPEAEAARAKGILIYVVGITLTDTREVEAIATPPASRNLFNIQSFDELVGLRQRIFSSVCPEKVEDLPPTANAGKDVVLQLPDDVVLLAGDKSTDDVAIVKYTWTQIGGPKVQVSPSDNPYLELRNLKEGTYLIELKVEDGKNQTDTDTVTITVLPEPDLPPVANAGPDKTIQLPEDSVELSGIKSTDDKGIVSYEWELTSPKDRTVVLRGTNSVTLNVDNLKEGDYTFTLSVRDKKGQVDNDTAIVKVLAARDLPPVANAGRDYEIQLPSNSVTLDGSRSTDDIGVVSYAWTMVSGDSRKVTMSGANSPMLRLDNLGEGDYVFRLVVSDKLRQTSSDEAKVSVKRAVRTSGYDVIFILDSSVAPNHFRWMTEYARAMIREMSIDDEEFRVGYLIYSNGAYRQFDLSDHTTKADVLSAADKVGYRPGNKNTGSAFKFVRKQMFTPSKGDRDFAKNYVVHLTGGNPSTNPFESALEACQMQNEGVGMFAVGFGEVSDRSELDAHSSLPTSDYELIVGSESDIGEQPGLMLYQLKRGSPRPSPCPVPTTTPRPIGPIKCTSSGDVIFILDSSGSVGQDNFYRVLNFTYTTVDGLDIDNGKFRIGVTTFSDTSRLDFNLNEFSTKRDIERALSEVVYMYGNTHTAHALRRARLEMFTEQAGDRPDVPNVVVIITDGQSNVNHELTIPEARHLKANGVTILTVAVGFTSETSELVGLTSPPLSENLIYVADYESLAKLKDQLVEPLCTDSNMCRNNPCQNGGVCMDGIRSFVCLCQPDFFGDTCGKRCGDPADVVIVLDSSDTVGQYNFGRLKEYAEHLVREMNKDSCDINLGFMKYSSAAMVQVNLGIHTDTETNIRALESISYSRGRANMAAAFTALRERMFNRGGGDRPGAKNIAYILTDGTNDVHAEMAEPEAELAISEGIRIIPIGINLRERFELDNIAQSQGLQVIEINDEPGLIENTDVILRPLYEGNDFCAENPCSNGGRCVNEPFGFTCDCPVGYTGDTCQKRCSAKGDVVFAVDTSRYVTRKELKQVRRFLRSVVKRMKFNRNEFSVGMVQFTDYAKVTLDFDEGSSKRNIRSQIAGLRVHGGDPDPATALAKANVRIFNGRGGSRDKPDYLILVTKSMRNEINVLNEANKLKVQGTRILGVGIGLTGSEREALESAVSMPYSETAMFANDVKELDDIADKIVEFMCDHEDLCAENPCRNGGTCQRMGGEFYCECGVGYAGRYCENRCEARADIIFLLDSSGSVGHADFRSVKEFVHRMVGDLQIGKDKTRVGLVTYSSQSRHGFFMSTYTNVYELQNAIAGIGYEYGNTNTADGLRRVRERYFGGQNGDRSEIQNFLVVITDGVSNVQPDQTLVEAQLLKDMGVHIYAVGIGQFDPTEINGIASKPASENAFVLSDFKALANISSSIVKKTCRDPTVCDENPCRNGGLCVPGINGPFCECRVGYRGEYCQESCVTVKDIYFLLDSSDSVGNNNFQTALNFTASIVEEFSSKDSHNRFALLTYSTDVQIVFSLGRYDKLPVIKNAIKYTRYRPGNSNLAGAFRVVKEIAVNALGDRSDAEDIIFVIADGNGNVDDNLTVQSAEELKKGGARIIPIAVNMNDYKEMEQIASAKNDLFKVSNYNSLPSVLEDIVRTTCKNGNVIKKE